MIREDNSKRTFFKKLVAAAGFVAAADYAKTWITAQTDSTKAINDKYAHDVSMHEKALLRKQLVLMTDNEKKQMLDEILDSYSKDHA